MELFPLPLACFLIDDYGDLRQLQICAVENIGGDGVPFVSANALSQAFMYLDDGIALILTD